jgi:hypothetical protein
MPESSILRCPSCGGRYQLPAESRDRAFNCKKCRILLVRETVAQAVVESPAPLVMAVRQALNKYGSTVPGHELRDLGAKATQLRVRSGRLYKVRVAVLTEERVAEWVWQGVGGKLAPPHLVKTFPTPPAPPPEPPTEPQRPPPAPSAPIKCPNCEGKKQVRCGRCQGTQRVPCKNCDASGSLKCVMCGGSGIVIRPDRHSGYDKRAACGRCFGRKVVACEECSGTSRSPCPDCPYEGPKVSGKVWCPTCFGKGIVWPEPPKSPPAHPTTVARDPWQADRPQVSEFKERYEQWTVDGSTLMTVSCPDCKGAPQATCVKCGNTGSVNCPICDGKGLRYCPSCDTLGCEKCDYTGRSNKECLVCKGRKVKVCDLCDGKVQKPCQVCAGALQFHRQLVVRRTIAPFVKEQFVGEIPCQEEAFRGWILPEDFVRIPPMECGAGWQRNAKGDYMLACHGSDMPTPVRQSISVIARELPEIGERRKVVPGMGEIGIARADAIHAQYVFEGKEFECWLLGASQQLHAPDNPITRLMDDQLKQVCGLAADGDRKRAARLLHTCRAMAEADPFCARRLNEASEKLPADLGDSKTWWSWLSAK